MIKIRNTCEGLEANTDENFGLIIISQNVTEADHEVIKKTLKGIINDDIRVDIFFKWNNISMIIFKTDFINSKLRKSINSSLKTTKHAILFNGVNEGNNSLSDVYITSKENCIQICKKFSTLLTMKKEIK